MGDSAVGKTSLVRRFVEDRFEDKYISTIGVKVSKRRVNLDINEENVELILLIWDVLGEQGYTSTHAMHIRGADCALLVCDMTRPETMESLKTYWLPILYHVTSSTLPPMMFAGNKTDLVSEDILPTERKFVADLLSGEETKEMLSQTPNFFLGWEPTSARTGEGIEKCFSRIENMLIHAHYMGDRNLDDIMKSLENMNVEDMIQGKPRTTYRALADLMIADYTIMVPKEESLSCVEDCFYSVLGPKKEFTGEKMKKLIDKVAEKAGEEGASESQVDQYKKKWIEFLAEIKE